MSAARIVAAVVVGAGAAVVVFADVLGLDASTPFVQLIAFRTQIAVALVLLALVVVLLARRGWPVALALGLVGVIGLGTVLPRVLGPGPASAAPVAAAAPAGSGELDVLETNTYLSQADPASLASMIRTYRPAVVTMPEAHANLRDAVIAALGGPSASGYTSTVAEGDGDSSPTTVLVARRLGRVRTTVDEGTRFPSVVIMLPTGLRVVAVHTEAPKPGEVRSWRRDVAALARWCHDGPPTVVSGDLNATWDHAELRDAATGCTDAASSVGDGLTGTWPSFVPRALGAQIDHVLLARGPRATSVEIVNMLGSDHRALLARIRTG